MQSEYFVYPIGTKVLLILPELEGIITEIVLDSHGTKYMIAYFQRGQHLVEVFRDVEFEAEKGPSRIWVIGNED